MNVKTADLKNNLSRYLRQVRETGEPIIVCDRDEPVATLSPIVRDVDAEWRRFRDAALARAKQLGIAIDIPVKRPTTPCMPKIRPALAADGRRDIRTITLVRGGRDY